MSRILFLLLALVVFCGDLYSQININFISVGYGDCCFIEEISEPNINILVDAGHKHNFKKIKKYLKGKNIKNIDYVFITHPHENHYGSLSEIIKSFEVKKLYWNGDARNRSLEESEFLRFLEKTENNGKSAMILYSGDVLDLSDDLKLEVLNPDIIEGSVNDAALVLKMYYKKIGFIIASDIGPNAQRRIHKSLGNQAKYKLDTQIMTYPHHGDCLIEEWQDCLRSLKYLIIQTGPNVYGNIPSLKGLKINPIVLRTDADGDIVLESDGENVWLRK
ncbi:MAG: MBL fold metallo-hydrolase [bacterium]